jgi:5'(3')-deoxyribonucleotidase
MILIDLNQVLLSGLMAQIASQKNVKLEENLVRHLVLNIIRGHVKQFRHEYGEVVLCCDNKKYWRKEFFPFYKASRKKTREKSDLDWHLIFNILGNLKQELKDHFPYKAIDVDGAEADDIIGTLVPLYAGENNKILILSSDGDFLQLQMYKNVKQYNPAQKKFIKSDNPLADLKEKIIKGDKGDGIPNVLSSPDCFVREIRQTPISKNRLEKMMNENYGDWEDENARIGYSRNQTLIDLRHIPADIKNSIIDTYNNTKPAPRSKMINYFMEKKLKNLMEVIEEF